MRLQVRAQTKTTLIVLVGLGLAALAIAFVRGKRAAEYQVGTSEEITAAIRQGLDGTRTKCDEGPPSADDRADWRRRHRVTKWTKTPLSVLVKASDHELESEIFGRLLDEEYDTGHGRMSRPEENAYLIFILEGEVANGGFHQFFSNSSGNCALQTQRAVREVAPDTYGPLYDRALAVFPGSSPSEDRAQRNRQMETLEDEWKAWSTIDDEFYEVDRGSLLAGYIRRHVDQFTPPTWYQDIK
ncbi:MAG: DUF4375 domain-containing protein [Polyangiaceae bacterium]